jgi:hypothetical protein
MIFPAPYPDEKAPDGFRMEMYNDETGEFVWSHGDSYGVLCLAKCYYLMAILNESR